MAIKSGSSLTAILNEFSFLIFICSNLFQLY
nr:MAG TPA: hypothetical protein [Caudoviricetes sp.]